MRGLQSRPLQPVQRRRGLVRVCRAPSCRKEAMPKHRKTPTQRRQSSPDKLPASNWRYYDLKRNWRKVMRHLDDPILEALRGHRACYWEVNLALRLAMLVEPSKEWRIIYCDDHSTVWDG